MPNEIGHQSFQDVFVDQCLTHGIHARYSNNYYSNIARVDNTSPRSSRTRRVTHSPSVPVTARSAARLRRFFPQASAQSASSPARAVSAGRCRSGGAERQSSELRQNLYRDRPVGVRIENDARHELTNSGHGASSAPPQAGSRCRQDHASHRQPPGATKAAGSVLERRIHLSERPSTAVATKGCRG